MKKNNFPFSFHQRLLFFSSLFYFSHFRKIDMTKYSFCKNEFSTWQRSNQRLMRGLPETLKKKKKKKKERKKEKRKIKEKTINLYRMFKNKFKSKDLIWIHEKSTRKRDNERYWNEYLEIFSVSNLFIYTNGINDNILLKGNIGIFSWCKSMFSF